MKYSFVIPAKNEAALIESCTNSIIHACCACSLDEDTYEILLVDNQSTDNISNFIYPVKNFSCLFSSATSIGKVREDGAKQAKGAYLIFVDADSEITKELLKVTIENIEFKSSIAGGCKLKIKGGTILSRSLCAVWNKLAKKNKWFPGCYLYVRKDFFFDLGGFGDLFICEDIDLSERLNYYSALTGEKTNYINTAHILTSDRALKMFTCKEHFNFWLSFFFQFKQICKDRNRCKLWYEIRR